MKDLTTAGPFGCWQPLQECPYRLKKRVEWWCKCIHCGCKRVIEGSRLRSRPPVCVSKKHENCMGQSYRSGYKIGHRRHLLFEQAEEIRRKAREGVSRRELAAQYGKGVKAIAQIIRGETHRTDEDGKPVPRAIHSSRNRRRFLDKDQKEVLEFSGTFASHITA